MDESFSQEVPNAVIAAIGLGILWAIGLLRILSESQRVTTCVSGRITLKGPGLVLRFPIYHKEWRLHSVGDLGYVIDEGCGTFQNIRVPITVSTPLHGAGTVKVVQFQGAGENSVFMVEPYGVV